MAHTASLIGSLPPAGHACCVYYLIERRVDLYDTKYNYLALNIICSIMLYIHMYAFICMYVYTYI
jgi:hypothetical protein